MISYEKQLIVMRIQCLMNQFTNLNDDFLKNQIIEDVLQLCLKYRLEKDIDMDTYECPEQCRCGRLR
jgi:hypothetical protein